MKKCLLSIIAILSLPSLHAQNIAEEFETWRNYYAKDFFTQSNITSVPLTNAKGWNSTDSLFIAFGKSFNPGGTFNAQIAKAAGHSGISAMQILSRIEDTITAGIGGAVQGGVCTNAEFGLDANNNPIMTGGMPFGNLLVKVSAWIKTDIRGTDASFFTAMLINDADGIDEIVGTADTNFTSSINGWTKITVPFVWADSTILPTRLRFLVGTTSSDTSGLTLLTDSTSITIDDIEINYFTGISSYVYSSGFAKVYPNPSNAYFYIDVPEVDQYSILIYDVFGKKVLNENITNRHQQFFIGDLCNGLYQYNIIGKHNEIVQTNKLEIAR
ncbi:MAG: T9SS type A sorting domain-containing protein [Chitinophagaceae bacterium]|nr:T9SS type A sorting domain-containing protein [Chitinophagaceae bacterium]